MVVETAPMGLGTFDDMWFHWIIDFGCRVPTLVLAASSCWFRPGTTVRRRPTFPRPFWSLTLDDNQTPVDEAEASPFCGIRVVWSRSSVAGDDGVAVRRVQFCRKIGACDDRQAARNSTERVVIPENPPYECWVANPIRAADNSTRATM
jgi:hypothetical protein